MNSDNKAIMDGFRRTQSLKSLSNALVVLLMLIAAAVFALKIVGVNAWDWLLISGYWLVLTVKNCADAAVNSINKWVLRRIGENNVSDE